MPLNDALVDSLDAKAESLAHRPVTKTATGLMMEKPGLFHIQPKANRMFSTTVEATVAREQPQLEVPNSPNPEDEEPEQEPVVQQAAPIPEPVQQAAPITEPAPQTAKRGRKSKKQEEHQAQPAPPPSCRVVVTGAFGSLPSSYVFAYVGEGLAVLGLNQMSYTPQMAAHNQDGSLANVIQLDIAPGKQYIFAGNRFRDSSGVENIVLVEVEGAPK